MRPALSSRHVELVDGLGAVLLVLDLADHVALYPGRMDRVTIDGEEVQAQEGDFYGGWITSRVTGPFKGAPGTWGW